MFPVYWEGQELRQLAKQLRCMEVDAGGGLGLVCFHKAAGPLPISHTVHHLPASGLEAGDLGFRVICALWKQMRHHMRYTLLIPQVALGTRVLLLHHVQCLELDVGGELGLVCVVIPLTTGQWDHSNLFP